MPVQSNRESSTSSFVWDIRDFTFLEMLKDRGQFLPSPIFNMRSINNKWKFLLYPKGKYDEKYVGFYISKLSLQNHLTYRCTLSIGRPDAAPVKSENYKILPFVSKDAAGSGRFLLKESNSRIFKGNVRFQCDVTEYNLKNRYLSHMPQVKYLISQPDLPDTTHLSLELEELWKQKFHSDLTVNISGQKMHVHKYILYSRCSNISTAFGYRSVTEIPSDVDIEVNPEIFELFMHYIYTGKLRDSCVPLELFRFAQRLGLLHLIQCVHEEAYTYHVELIPDTEKQVINWNLDELGFLEEDSTSVHILPTTLYPEQLVIQVRVSGGCENEKFIDVSFQFFRFEENCPISFLCKISLTSPDGIVAFKEEQHVFRDDGQWDFPRFLCEKDKEYKYTQDMQLTVELIMFDGSNVRASKIIKTKTKLYTNFQTVTDNLENLHNSMGVLFQIPQPTSNLLLLSEDRSFHVHDGIMWARWPGLRQIILASPSENANDVTRQVELKMPSEVLKLLLSYFYTAFISNFDEQKAEAILKYRNYLEYPDHLVKICEKYVRSS